MIESVIEERKNIKDKNSSSRYKHSEQLLDRALKSIPLGSQTFSKSKTHYPLGASPFFAKKALGSKLWDVDGNEYIDFASALGAIILGYNDKVVTESVVAQLQDGTIFSLSHELEIEVAEKIIELIPCAEMVRFGKNGSDVTTAAIRIARAYTGRDHVAVCGYHGWHDWYIGSTNRNLGVPAVVQGLTHKFEYNSIESLEKIFKENPRQIAAVILEPMNKEYPKDNFLQKVKEITHKNGAILIFDEMITGFRFALGGAQELFGVTPDLATFGKAVANGFPLSVIAGKRHLMKVIEDIFFSFTFGGETLSLAAGLATMEELQKRGAIENITQIGVFASQGILNLIKKHSLEEVISINGHPSWLFVDFNSTQFSPWEFKTFFLEECFKNGILTGGSFLFSNSHSLEDIQVLLNVLDQIFCKLKKAFEVGALDFQGQLLKPLFVVR